MTLYSIVTGLVFVMVLLSACERERRRVHYSNPDFLPLIMAAGANDKTSAVAQAYWLVAHAALWISDKDVALAREIIDATGGASETKRSVELYECNGDLSCLRYKALCAELTGDMQRAAQTFAAAYQLSSNTTDILLATRCAVYAPASDFRSNIIERYYAVSTDALMQDAIRNMDDMQQGIYERVLVRSRKYPDTPIFRYQELLALLHKRKYNEALEPARWLLKDGPRDASVLALAGRAAFLAQEFALAHLAFRNLQAEELDDISLLEMARSSAFKCQDWNDVVRFGEKLLQLQPHNDEHYRPVIMAYAMMHRYDAARRRIWEYSQRNIVDATNAYARWIPQSPLE